MKKDQSESFKIILAGGSGVGKSSLLLRLVDNVFHDYWVTTVQVDFKYKTLEFKGEQVKLQIWDTVGQSIFHNILRKYYQNAKAIVLVYALDDPLSFLQMINQGIEEAIKYKNADCQLMILANKSDLKSSFEESSDFKVIKQRDDITLWRVVSAKTGHQVLQAFTELAEIIMVKNVHKKQKIRSKTTLQQYPSLKHPNKNKCF